jgi:putative peptidoglycan lipid II flippase
LIVIVTINHHLHDQPSTITCTCTIDDQRYSSASVPPNIPPPVGKTALALVPFVVVARGAGFFVSMAVAAWYGVGAATDAWYWSLGLPAVALVVASSTAATAITPHLARLRVDDPREEGALIGGAAVWTAALSTAVCLPFCLFAPVVARATSFDDATRSLAVRFLWEALPLVALMSAAAILRAACEVRAQFRAVSLLPLFRALAALLFLAASRSWLGVHALPWSLFAGELVGIAISVALLRTAGVRIGLGMANAARTLRGDVGLLLVGEVLVALHVLVDKGTAGLLPPGSVATLEFASRARVIPQTILEGTLVMVAFSTWSRLRAERQSDESRAQMAQSLRWTIAIATPVIAGMFVARHVIVALLFQRGEFSADDATRTASLLAWYLPGVLPTLLATLAMKALVVERNLALVAWMGLGSLVLKIAFNIGCVQALGLDGVALSSTIVSLVVALVYVAALRLRHPGLGASVAIVTASAAVAALVEVYGAPRSLVDPALWIAAVCLVGVLGVGARRG